MRPSSLSLSRIPRPLRYILTGAFVFCCDWAMFYFFVHLSESASISNLASRTLAIPISFYLQRLVTFTGAQTQRTPTQLWRFLLLWGLATGVGALILEAVRVPFGANMASLVKFPLEIAIAFINYFIMKHWVYRAENSV
jgi:putative flippase GtrA